MGAGLVTILLVLWAFQPVKWLVTYGARMAGAARMDCSGYRGTRGKCLFASLLPPHHEGDGGGTGLGAGSTRLAFDAAFRQCTSNCNRAVQPPVADAQPPASRYFCLLSGRSARLRSLLRQECSIDYGTPPAERGLSHRDVHDDDPGSRGTPKRILAPHISYRQLDMATHPASPVGEVRRSDKKVSVAPGRDSGLVHLGSAVTVVQAVVRNCSSPRSSCRCRMDLCRAKLDWLI